jgi:hypothetical protein
MNTKEHKGTQARIKKKKGTQAWLFHALSAITYRQKSSHRGYQTARFKFNSDHKA